MLAKDFVDNFQQRVRFKFFTFSSEKTFEYPDYEQHFHPFTKSKVV